MEINDLRGLDRPRFRLWPWRAEDKSQNTFATKDSKDAKDSKDKRKEASFFVPVGGFLRPVHFWLCPATFPSCLPSRLRRMRLWRAGCKMSKNGRVGASYIPHYHDSTGPQGQLFNHFQRRRDFLLF
jgi:hypothetical protein